jgi:hypothetical protein
MLTPPGLPRARRLGDRRSTRRSSEPLGSVPRPVPDVRFLPLHLARSRWQQTPQTTASATGDTAWIACG